MSDEAVNTGFLGITDSPLPGSLGSTLANIKNEVKQMAKPVSSGEFEKLKFELPNEATVLRPSYYTSGRFELIDVIRDLNLNFNRGNALKYICRAGRKHIDKEIEDLQKAIVYLEHEIAALEEE